MTLSRTPQTSTAEYSVPISSIRFGGQELLNFATVINKRVPGRMSWLPAILDSVRFPSSSFSKAL